MNSRRTFLASLPVLTCCAVSVHAQKPIDGADSAKTVEEIKKSLLFATEWTEGEFGGRKLLLVLTALPTSGESYIDLHGWLYNAHYQEWRRFLKVNTRNIGHAKLHLDTQNGVVSIRGAANNELNGVEVLRFDLRATNNDGGYKP